MRCHAITRYGLPTTLENGFGICSDRHYTSRFAARWDTYRAPLELRLSLTWTLFYVGDRIGLLETFRLVLAFRVRDAARGPQGLRAERKAGCQELHVPVASVTLLREACANDACDIARSSDCAHRPQGPWHTWLWLLPHIDPFLG
jgi:hypothetical protein